MSDGLTMEALQEAIARLEALKPLYYYAETDAVAPGAVIEMRETEWTHRAFLFRTGEFEAFRRQSPSVRWVHLRDAPPKIPPLSAVRYGQRSVDEWVPGIGWRPKP